VALRWCYLWFPTRKCCRCPFFLCRSHTIFKGDGKSLRAFTEEAKVNHAANKWDPKIHQIFSADEAEVDEYLADDDDMNKMDEPTLFKTKKKHEEYIQVNVP
jgi:hypothetical protein